MLWMRLAGLRSLADRRQTDLAPQPPDAFAAEAPALTTQVPRHLPLSPGHLDERFVGDLPPRKFRQSDVESVQPEGADEMRKSRFTEAQIIGMIKEQEAGMATAEVCRRHGLSPATFYKLKAKYGGMDVSDAQRLKTLENENGKLRRLLADAMLGTTSC